MKFQHTIFLALFFVLSAIPLAEMKLSLAPKAKLSGSVPKPPAIPWTIQSLWDGTFQSAVEQNFNHALGLRAHMVKSDNEINLRVFGELNSANADIVVGKNNMLYQKGYINALIKRDLAPASALEEKVIRLKRLQDHLRSRNKAFLLVISANKAMLYPEDLPEHFKKEIPPERQSNYDAILPLLEKHGVHYFDGHGLLERNKVVGGFRRFAKSAAHWNDHAACEVTDGIAEALSKQFGRPLVRIDCSETISREAPRDIDRDLSDLGNTWSKKILYEPVPYPVSKAVKTGSEFRPNVLLIGGSYVWPLLKFAEKHNVFKRDAFLYYYQKKVTYPGKKQLKVDRANFDWDKEFYSRDAVIVEANTTVLPDAGFGFVENALAEIERREQLAAVGNSLPEQSR